VAALALRWPGRKLSMNRNIPIYRPWRRPPGIGIQWIQSKPLGRGQRRRSPDTRRSSRPAWGSGGRRTGQRPAVPVRSVRPAADHVGDFPDGDPRYAEHHPHPLRLRPCRAASSRTGARGRRNRTELLWCFDRQVVDENGDGRTTFWRSRPAASKGRAPRGDRHSAPRG